MNFFKLGHEGVGVVEGIGPGVTTKNLGDICVVHWRQSSIGIRAESGSYFSQGKKISSGKVVTFSKHAVIPECNLTVVHTRQASPQLSLLGCAYPTGWGSVFKVGKLRESESVLISGIGGVGTACLNSLRGTELSNVYALDPYKQSLRGRIDGQPFSHFRSLSEEQFKALSPDLIVETSGSVELIENIIDWAAPGTRLVLVGMPKDRMKARIDTQKLLDGVELTASNGGMIDYGLDFATVYNSFAQIDFKSTANFVAQLPEGGLSQAIELHRLGSQWRVTLEF